ncbi:MAG TPA: hypothetical protein PLL10_11185, partial [Elusimicrobiales bacterium]|nr:hypothetical protein [Elusimicrobiales bacterium]
KILSALLGVFLLLSFWNFAITVKFNSACRDSQLEFMEAVQAGFKDNPKIYFYPVSSPLMALFNGNLYGGNTRGMLLEKLYPLKKTWFVHRFRPELWTWNGPADSESVIDEHYDRVILLGNAELCHQPLPGLRLRKIMEGGFCNDESASVPDVF